MNKIEPIQRIKEKFSDESFSRRFFMVVTYFAFAMSAVLLLMTAASNMGNADISALPPAPSQSTSSQIKTTDSNAAGKQMTVKLTDEEAASLVSIVLSEQLKVEDIKISFLSPNTFEINGSVMKESVGKLIGEDNSLVNLGLILAPEKIDTRLRFNISYDGETRRFSASPDEVSISNIDVTRLIPDSVVEAACDALNSAIPENLNINDVRIEDGSISFDIGI
jgi:hypothetical protein